jgi:hypothetical protein
VNKTKKANLRQQMFKDLFATAMEEVREKLWHGGANGGWGGLRIRRRARAMARKIAREALREELKK